MLMKSNAEVLGTGNRSRVLGVLGGMGPMATAHFYQMLVDLTPSTSDQGHIPVVIWGDGRIPDRSDHLMGIGSSPVPAMIEAIRGLMCTKADIIAVPCNTAHAFLPEVVGATGARVFDMIRSTIGTVVSDYEGVARVGILGTRGSRLARVYDVAAAERGLETVYVPAEQQISLVDEAIRMVKGGGRVDLSERLVGEAATTLKSAGAEVVILGCTELILVARIASRILPTVDSLTCLATACTREFASPGGWTEADVPYTIRSSGQISSMN